ncbi:hypothetical protein CR513_00105, partial [Mucuna pruriens]
MPQEYKGSHTCNVSDLSPYDTSTQEENLRANSFQEGGLDEILTLEEEPQERNETMEIKALQDPRISSIKLSPHLLDG